MRRFFVCIIIVIIKRHFSTDYDYQETFTENDEIILPLNSTKAGFMFAGWYENSDLSGSPVGVVQLGTTIDKTFYAKWKKDIGSNIASSYIYTGFNTVNDTFFESLDIINIAFSIANSS